MMDETYPGWDEYFARIGQAVEEADAPVEAARHALLNARFLLKVKLDEATAQRGRDIINQALVKLEQEIKEDILPAVVTIDTEVVGHMTNDEDVPAWVVACVRKWLGILHLDAWAIRLKLACHPNGEEETTALVDVWPNIMTARITIKATVPQVLDGQPDEVKAFWEMVIIHELVHVFMGRITDFIEKDVMPELAPAAQRIAGATLTREVEPVVELLANVLYGLSLSHG